MKLGTIALKISNKAYRIARIIMERLKLSNLNLAELKRHIELTQKKGIHHSWLNTDDIQLSERETRYINDLQQGLKAVQVHLFNEATLWSRAIYPLLQLAEEEDFQVWAEISLSAQYPQFEMEEIADGVIGPIAAGRLQASYFVMVETKRGTENSDPVYQLYGQLLAAAWMNAQVDGKDEQEIFGCYTIADAWTFVRGEVGGICSDRPTLTVEFSPEYTEKVEASTILKILKSIIRRYL
jgi:hypothetical protein